MQNLEKYYKKLPIIPEVASKIMSIGDDSESLTFKALEEIITVDPMLTTRILKVANSAMYARQKEITTLQMAIGLLGFKNIKSLVILLTASQFSKNLENDIFYNDFWRHSIVTAFISREIFIRMKDRMNQDKAFILGLLHDIGQVALFNENPDEYKRILISAKNRSLPILDVEKQVLKSDHREVGAAVLRHWNLPEIFVETAREHGNLKILSRNQNMVRNISIADKLAGKLGFGNMEFGTYSHFNEMVEQSTLVQKDIDYFLHEYVEHMEEDPLFKECEKLFLSGKTNGK